MCAWLLVWFFPTSIFGVGVFFWLRLFLIFAYLYLFWMKHSIFFKPIRVYISINMNCLLHQPLWNIVNFATFWQDLTVGPQHQRRLPYLPNMQSWNSPVTTVTLTRDSNFISKHINVGKLIFQSIIRIYSYTIYSCTPDREIQRFTPCEKFSPSLPTPIPDHTLRSNVLFLTLVV